MLKLNPVKYSKHQKRYIKNLGITKYEDWMSNNIINEQIKKTIKTQMLKNQSQCCAYCNLKFYETSRPEIEHIAPRKLYPEFEYINKNLVMACQYCNGSSKKGSKNTIKTKNQYYNTCHFNIVHPFYDNAEDYFEQSAFIIKIKNGLSGDMKEKAEMTFKIFGIATPEHVEARAKQMLYDTYMATHTLDVLHETLLNSTSTYP